MANEPKGLYDLIEYYRLLISGVWVYINEPEGWDKIKITGERDKEFLGLNNQFIDEKLTLLFLFGIIGPERLPGGGDEIFEQYELNRSDAEVAFEFGYYQNSIPIPQFKGTLNFNDYSKNKHGIEISIQKIFFQSLLRTRYETKVAMNATVDLDGNSITPPTPLTIKLHSKKIQKFGRGENQTEVASDTGNVTGPNGTVYLQPDTTNITKAEVEEVQSMPLGFSAVTAPSEQRFQFIAIEEGPATLRFQADYWLQISNHVLGSGNIGTYSLVPEIQVYRGGTFFQAFSPSSARIDGSIASTNLEVHHVFDFTVAANLQVNDEVYFNININTSTSGSLRKYRAFEYVGAIEIMQETIAEPSYCTGYRLYDVLDHIIRALTGRMDSVVVSEILFSGCAEKYIITNGYQIRNFNIAEKPVLISLKDALEGLVPIFGLMVQYSINKTGQDVILIERIPHFFGSNRILTLDADKIDYDAWEENHAKDVTFNEVEIGYQKYSEDDINTLDEFNTFQQWLLPIKSYKGKFERKSKLVASGYSIEIVRREQFKENPSTSLSADDDLFIISYITERIHYNVNFTVAGSSLSFTKPLNMYPGDTFHVLKDGGGANDATLFTVIARDTTSFEKYVVSPAPAADAGIATIDIDIDQPESEKNEAFDQVDNLISPETAYNLRISPKRNLLNHSELLNCCLDKKPDSDQLKNTFTKSNNQLTTRFSDQADCKFVDDNISLKEANPIPLPQFNSRRSLFEANEVSFPVEMYYDQFVFLVERLIGQSGTVQDFGVVAFPDLVGEWYEGYVWGYNYDPNDKKAELLIKKKRKIS